MSRKIKASASAGSAPQRTLPALAQLGDCALCARPMVAGVSVDDHHLVPRSQGGREKVTIHKICHRKIHATLSEKELARHYCTWASLQLHPEIQQFIQWVQNKKPEFFDNSRRPARRRRS